MLRSKLYIFYQIFSRKILLIEMVKLACECKKGRQFYQPCNDCTVFNKANKELFNVDYLYKYWSSTSKILN